MAAKRANLGQNKRCAKIYMKAPGAGGRAGRRSGLRGLLRENCAVVMGVKVAQNHQGAPSENQNQRQKTPAAFSAVKLKTVSTPTDLIEVGDYCPSTKKSLIAARYTAT